MKEILTTDVLTKMLKQKQNLIAANPKLGNFFTDIYLPFPDIQSSIPFLPIRCFRDFNLFLDEKNTSKKTVFLSSGSTNAIQARHIFTEERLELYADNSRIGFENFLNHHNIKKDTPIISLIPPKAVWNKSSLAAMIDMLQTGGFLVDYCDVENKPDNIVQMLLKPQFQKNAIIFGTTFHHLLVAEHTKKQNITDLFKGKSLALIDTGGTKGRTQTFTLDETLHTFQQAYGNPKEFLFLSEYGMCELASQAWSTKKIHDGTFICNKTLTPFAINLRERRALREGEYGFLAFFDSINMESWPTIITEDIACIVNQEERIFNLKGRSPDATLKGCSLNVKESFFFLDMDSNNENNNSSLPNSSQIQKQFSSPQEIHDFIETLNPAIWTPNCWSDLAESLNSWNDIQIHNPNLLSDKNILIIASANIPITWLYPARIASRLGAKSVHIKLPSLRSDDPLSAKIRLKIWDLAEKLSPYLLPTNIIVEKTRSLTKEFHEFDKVIVFGTDTTIATFQKLFQSSNLQLIPQGDVKNSLKVSLQHSTEDVAKLCSLWFGRGCLTPICLFMSGRSPNQVVNWIHEFQLILEKNFNDRYKTENINPQFIHENQLLYTSVIVKNLGLDPSKTIFSGKTTHIFNFTKLSSEELLQSRLDFSFGGSGFVFVLDESVKSSLPQLSSEKIIPALNDKHGGKTWEEWFTN